MRERAAHYLLGAPLGGSGPHGRRRSVEGFRAASRIRSVIADALKGKTILVTGSTGFLGKSIVEKCLRSIPEIARINLAIRSSARRPAAERLEREVLSSPAFKRLKEELGDEAFAKLGRDKLAVVEIDLGRDGLGLTDEARQQI